MSDGSETGAQKWLYESFFTPYLSPVNASLAWAVTFVLFWLVILWVMYNRKNHHKGLIGRTDHLCLNAYRPAWVAFIFLSPVGRQGCNQIDSSRKTPFTLICKRMVRRI